MSTIKEFTVLPRNKAKELSYNKLSKKYAIISITDKENEPVRFPANPMITAILPLSFNDTDDEASGAITDGDADIIARFVTAVSDKVDCLVVHCEAGVSRSAGVCAAIMKSLTDDDMAIFNNSYYKPNMRCYRKVLEAFWRKKEANEQQY